MANRYWVGGTAAWDGTAGTKWAATSGGAGGETVPTTADDVFFDAASTGTCTIATGNTGAKSINCTGFTGTIAGTAAITVAGSVTLDAGQTYTHTGTMTFTGTGTLTTAGKAIGSVTVDGVGITLTLGDALNIGGRAIVLRQGTFDAANYNVTIGRVEATTTNTCTITMGSGLWTFINAAAVWNTAAATNLTLNKNTANILLSNNTTTARSFLPGTTGLSFNKLTIGGNTSTSVTTVGGTASFTELASTKTVAHTVRFNASGHTIDTWSITGSAGNVVTVDSSAAGTRRTFNLTNVTSGIDYLSVKDIGVNQDNRFYVGANSTDGGNNLNVIFTAAPSGAQNLDPDLYSNSNVFYTHVLTGYYALAPPLYANANTFYSATVTQSGAAQSLTPARYDNTNTFYTAAVVRGAVTLAPARYDNTNTFYSATVIRDAVNIYPSFLTNQNAFFSAKITGGAILAGGGGGENSYSSKTPNPRGRAKGIGFANERAQHEAALAARFSKQNEILKDSNLPAAKQVSKRLDAYLKDKGTAAALQRQLDKLQALINVQESNEENRNQLNEALKAAADEIQDFLDDEQDAIDLFIFNEENENMLLLAAMGF